MLNFYDIALPHWGSFRGPTMADVSDALAFARVVRERSPDGALAVHCLHGRSRSAAIALAVMADEFGPGREVDAVAALMRDDVDNRMQPKPLIVSMADAALFRYGRLDTALEAASSRYVGWKRYWQEVAVDPEKAWQRMKAATPRRRGRHS